MSLRKLFFYKLILMDNVLFFLFLLEFFLFQNLNDEHRKVKIVPSAASLDVSKNNLLQPPHAYNHTTVSKTVVPIYNFQDLQVSIFRISQFVSG